jgi:hypothetical protein
MVLGKKHAVGVDVDDSSVVAGGGGLPATPEAFKWMIEEFFFLSGGHDIGDNDPVRGSAGWTRTGTSGG